MFEKCRRMGYRLAVVTAAAVVLAGAVGTGSAGGAPRGAGAVNGSPCPPPPVGDQRFVWYTYQRFGDQCPTADELTWWTAYLGGGGSRSFFFYQVFTSEASTLQLADYGYGNLLSRDGDPGGLAYWAQYLRNTKRFDLYLATLGASGEAYAVAGGTNPAYVDKIYDVFLDRAPDVGGAAYWEGFLDNGGSRLAFTSAVAQTQESTTAVIIPFLYLIVLNRAPDPAGLGFWVQAYDATNHNFFFVGAGLGGSQEYYNRTQTPV